MKWVNMASISIGSVAVFAGVQGLPVHQYLLIALGVCVATVGAFSLVAGDEKR